MYSNFDLQNKEFKRVFSLRVKEGLKDLGFEPLVEVDNANKPGYKCWVYEKSPAFMAAFQEVANRKGDYNG